MFAILFKCLFYNNTTAFISIIQSIGNMLPDINFTVYIISCL